MDLDLNNAVVGTQSSNSYSDPTKSTTDFYNGGSKDTDGATASESSFTEDFAKWHNYYVEIPVFAAIIDTLACWAVGKGYKADEANLKKIQNIKGWGKDDFNSIIENLTRVCLMGGDAQAESVRDKAKRLTNLKPLNPGKIKVIVNSSGVLERYEQKDNQTPLKPEEIFHLCWNRFADEIHGKPYAERLEPLIKQIKQLQDDLGIRFHRIVKPLRLFEAATDDPTTLSTTEANLKKGYENCEFIVIPKGTLEAKDAATVPSAVDAIQYMNVLLRELVSACGVPEVILGWSEGTTDASAKIVYLAFQQRVERIQKFLEEQIRLQLGVEINFEFPASLEPVMQTAGDVGKAPVEKPPVNNPPAADDKKKGSQLKK
jgi:hypothetical protein